MSNDTPSLSILHQQRWGAAKRLFQRMKDMAEADKEIKILMDGRTINPSQICIGDEDIHVREENAVFVQFVANPNYDEGLELTIKKFEDGVRSSFSLVKPVRFWRSK